MVAKCYIDIFCFKYLKCSAGLDMLTVNMNFHRKYTCNAPVFSYVKDV